MKVKSGGGPDLPREVCIVLMDQLIKERSFVIAIQKSAKGIVGCILATEGLNKYRKVIVREVFLNGTC